jgi:hypothetical protein
MTRLVQPPTSGEHLLLLFIVFSITSRWLILITQPIVSCTQIDGIKFYLNNKGARERTEGDKGVCSPIGGRTIWSNQYCCFLMLCSCFTAKLAAHIFSPFLPFTFICKQYQGNSSNHIALANWVFQWETGQSKGDGNYWVADTTPAVPPGDSSSTPTDSAHQPSCQHSTAIKRMVSALKLQPHCMVATCHWAITSMSLYWSSVLTIRIVVTVMIAAAHTHTHTHTHTHKTNDPVERTGL